MEGYVIEQLRQSRLFYNFSEEMLGQIIPRLDIRIKKYVKNEMIFETDHKVEFLGVVLSGELCAVTMDYNGQENLLQKLYAGYTVGAEIACTYSQLSPYSLYCFKAAELFLFPYKIIYEHGIILETERSILIQNLMEFMAYLNQKRFLKSYVLSAKGARERIMRYLLAQARNCDTDDFIISYNREQLANFLCLNRSVLSHELGMLKKEGILDFRKNKFKIKKKIEKVALTT